MIVIYKAPFQGLLQYLNAKQACVSLKIKYDLQKNKIVHFCTKSDTTKQEEYDLISVAIVGRTQKYRECFCKNVNAKKC